MSGPGEGERLVSGPRVAFVKGDLPDISVFEFHLDGHFEGPEPHNHSDHTDSFYVLEGEVEFTVEHTFGKPGPGRARLLNIHAPDAGFADALRRMSD